MNNKEKYDNIFVEVFGIEPAEANESLTKESRGDWDSVHQLNIVALIEETFDIMMDPEDIVAITSYANGLEVLRKFDVEI